MQSGSGTIKLNAIENSWKKNVRSELFPQRVSMLRKSARAELLIHSGNPEGLAAISNTMGK